MQHESIRQIFEKYSNIKFQKIRPMGAELFHAEWQAGITKLTVAFRNFANASKNSTRCWYYVQVLSMNLRTNSDFWFTHHWQTGFV